MEQLKRGGFPFLSFGPTPKFGKPAKPGTINGIDVEGVKKRALEEVRKAAETDRRRLYDQYLTQLEEQQGCTCGGLSFREWEASYERRRGPR